MLRDKSLIPLSHQHRRALLLCVRIDRAQPILEVDLPAWRREIDQQFEQEIRSHFAAEEEILFPAAEEFPSLLRLVEELRSEHDALRARFSEAASGVMSAEHVVDFGRQLSTHIRREERELFEGLQNLLSAEQLAELGMKLSGALRGDARNCELDGKPRVPRDEKTRAPGLKPVLR